MSIYKIKKSLITTLITFSSFGCSSNIASDTVNNSSLEKSGDMSDSSSKEEPIVNNKPETVSELTQIRDQYDFFYHKDIFDKELYRDENIIDNDAQNLLFFGENGQFAKFSGTGDAQDFICGGISYPKTSGRFTGENLWCITYKNKEYVSNKSEFIVDDEYLIRSVCRESAYNPETDSNRCETADLYVNDLVIDSVQIGDKRGSAGFNSMQRDGADLVYANNLGYFKYNLDDKQKNKLESGIKTWEEDEIFLTEDGQYYYNFLGSPIAVDANDEISIKKAGVTKGKIAFMVEREDSIDSYLSDEDDFKFNPYDVYFENNKYENVTDFLVYDGDIYYYRLFFVETINKDSTYSSKDRILKVSLIKNERKIDEYYIKYSLDVPSSFSSHRFMEIYPNCIPKTSICLHPEQNDYLLSGVNYLEPLIGKIGDELITTYPSYFKTSSNSINGLPLDGEVNPYSGIQNMSAHLINEQYLLMGNNFGSSYYLVDIDNPEIKPELMYEGTFPRFILKN